MSTIINPKKSLINRKVIMLGTIAVVIVAWVFFPMHSFCQNAFETSFNKMINSLLTADTIKTPHQQLFPNDALASIMTPSGFGGYGTYIFGGIAGIYPQVYSHKPDLITSGGFCVGNPIKAVNFAASVNMADVHRLRDFSGNFVLSKVIFTGSSISAGVLQLFANSRQSDAPTATYYFAFSHAIQTLPSNTPGSSKLSYTIGAGTGRFYLMSPEDIANGKSKSGTAIFGSISFEMMKHTNINAEWTGNNLALSLGLRPLKQPLSVGLGVTNLTAYSADKPGMIFSIGYPLSLTR